MQYGQKKKHEANKLRKDAMLLEEAGCFAIVLEKIPATLAKEVSESLPSPLLVLVPVEIVMARYW